MLVVGPGLFWSCTMYIFVYYRKFEDERSLVKLSRLVKTDQNGDRVCKNNEICHICIMELCLYIFDFFIEFYESVAWFPIWFRNGSDTEDLIGLE